MNHDLFVAQVVVRGSQRLERRQPFRQRTADAVLRMLGAPPRRVAALVLGIADVMGKYYVPQLGAFVVYLLMVIILFVRPQGLFGEKIIDRV